MSILGTPDARFDGLADYSFAPHWTQVPSGEGETLRIHAVDEGPRGAAPDLVGFGKSDKPSEQDDYTYEHHVSWMSAWLVANDLRDITLFCQDWGGLIGLRLVAAFPERFARLVIANTGLPVGTGRTDAFQQWLDFSQNVPELLVGEIVSMGTRRGLSEAEKAAWKVLEAFEKPVLTAFSDGDPVSKGGERVFQERVPGARGQPHVIIADGGHFLQEDKPEELVALIDGFIKKTS